MGKFKKKAGTEEKNIINAEEKLNIKFPQVIRERLKAENGFQWGYWVFYCVYDEEDKFHTFDDIIRQNQNDLAGWQKYIPEGYAAIASEDNWCLVLKLGDNESKVYQYNNETGELTLYAENSQSLKDNLDKEEKEKQEIYNED